MKLKELLSTDLQLTRTNERYKEKFKWLFF